MKRITSTDLASWNSRNCQEYLPLLIRRLIRASDVDINRIQIPVGDNIILPGYDGSLEVSNGTYPIPTEKSVWEIGSGKDFEKKAENDFCKRSKSINASEASEITFVFVTSKIWADKEKWIQLKRSIGLWRDVLVVDALVLEEWIEQLPSVGVWLATLLEKPFGNIFPIDQFWQEWCTNLKYQISTGLVISGRENEASKLASFFSNDHSVLSVKASTVEESIAFIGASIYSMQENLKEEIFAKSCIVNNENDFRTLIAYKAPLILIANFQVGSLADVAVVNGHHVIIPISTDVTAVQADIELARIRRLGFEEELQKMGFQREEAEQLTRDSGQSLSVLRRLLKFEKNRQPIWAQNGHHIDILPALLLGMWDEGNEEDKSIVSFIAGEPYETYISKLTRWQMEKDPPVLKIKNTWRLTSTLDAWSILSAFVTKNHLDNLRGAFLKVVGEINPDLQLEPEVRYLRNIYGKAPKFSYWLKEGVCQSLIMIGVFGENFKLKCIQSPQAFVDILIRDLLHSADGNTWCSLHRTLPLLAEASPKSFLNEVESSLRQSDPPIMKLFTGGTRNDNFFTSVNYYPQLLWAFENLLFSPEYILRATLILGKLSRLDPGGELVNRPINSLRAAYIPWFRQTQADLTSRKNVLEKLMVTEPDVAWKLFLSISPQDHASVSPIHKCKWRFNTQRIERIATQKDVIDFYSFLFDKLLILAEGNESRTSVLVDFYPNLNFPERDKLLDFLKKGRSHYQEKNLVWNELRQLLSKHKEHSKQQWALLKSDLAKLEVVFNLYTPETTKEKCKYLFEEDWPYFPEGIKRQEMSHDESEKLSAKKRKSAFRKIYVEEKIEGIFELVNEIKLIHLVARTAAQLKLTKTEEKKILALLSPDQKNKHTAFALEYIFTKALNDEAWVKWAWKIVSRYGSDPETCANFFLYLPQRKCFWEILDDCDADISKIYWQKMRPHFFRDNNEDALYIISNLQAVNRNVIILDNIAYYAKEFSSKLLADLLEKAITTKSDEEFKIERHHIGQIFKQLHLRNDLSQEKLSQLEWMYLPFLASDYGEQKPINLFHKLTRDPEFFTEIVSYVYMPEDNTNQASLSEEELKTKYALANNARQLLDAWRGIPGSRNDGTIDLSTLNDWIYIARKKAIEINRIYGVDSEIGNLLGSFPRNIKNWPPDEICSAIEELNSDVVLSHFECEIVNSRGVTSRLPFSGGEPERNLAKYFKEKADRISNRYPFTATALFNLAERYKRQAIDEDESALLDEMR